MIIVLRATSCSGKSTFIKNNFGEESENHVMSSDKFREMLFGTKTEQRMNKKVFETMNSFIESRLVSRVPLTIVDATHLRFKDCEAVLTLSKKYKVPLMFISIQPPALDELKRRNKKRMESSGFFVPEEVLEKHYNRYFTAIDPFIKEAIYNDLVKFTEIDQEYNVVRFVEGKS